MSDGIGKLSAIMNNAVPTQPALAKRVKEKKSFFDSVNLCAVHRITGPL